MRTNVIVGGLLAVAGALICAPPLAEEPADAKTVRNSAQARERDAHEPGPVQSAKSQRRERVRYTFPPTKR